MWRYLTGGAALIAFAGAAVLFLGGKAPSAAVLKPQPAGRVAGGAGMAPEPLPDAAPEATELTREQKRFDRYDKDRDGAVTRDEYLVARRKTYAKLDVDGDGRLSFDEWAVKTTDKFAAADKDRSGSMTAAEFVATAPKRKAAVRVKCPPAGAPAGREEEEG